MFRPLNIKTICLVISGCLMATTAFAQSSTSQSAFDARYEAMQTARERAASPVRPETARDEQVRQVAYQQEVRYVDPSGQISQPTRPVARQARLSANPVRRQSNVNNRPIRTAARQVPQRSTAPRMSNQTQAQAGYQPQHLRTAQLYDSSMGGTIIDGGIPMEGTIVGGDMGMTDMGMPVASAPMQYATPVGGSCGPGCGGGCGSCGGGPIGTSFVDTGAVYDGGVVQECGTCFDQGSVCDPCFDRGGCPPGQPCWLSGLSQLLRNGEYFAGATGFQGPGFSVGTNPASQVDDCNFGFYEGFNIGLPLCQLTCGLFSGQIGARAVQSNFNGTSFTPDQRDQLFVTAGLFRRVDQGFQFGVVYDYLDDQWFTNSTVGQVRGDLGWVFGNGKTLGFRFADNVEDDVSGGTVSGSTFAGLTTSTEQWYRVYLRGTSPVGGWGEVFGGGSSDYGIVGFNGDLPLSNMIAMQSGFTYYIGDGNGTGGADADAWNMYLGLSIRPRGFGWYNHYDTPLLPVADNGTMLLSR